MTPPIQARGLTKRFTRRGRTVDALVDVDLEVPAGATTVVAGPSLSGKTTLLDVLAGWTVPDAGTAGWFGRTEPPGWSRLAVVPQAFALLDELTVEENVLFASRVGDATIDGAFADATLERIGLAPLRRRLASELSVGERQRVMVARALVGRPAALLADDPVSHQDDHHADVVLGLIDDLATSGSACLVATRADGAHRRFGGRTWTLEHGRLLASAR